MKNTLPLRLRFGVFELDVKSGELQKSGQRIVLQEQPLQVLCILVENAGAITTRENIQQQLWPNDTVVEFDHSINAAIKKLRVALGDSADNPKYIETIARRGYRFMVPVERLESSVGSKSDAPPDSSSHDGTGVVQVPLEPIGLSGKTVSHYRVLEIVGGGGMGVVYKAEDLKLGRSVALKFLPEELGDNPQALERFEREARAASSLDHSNICSIYEFGEHEGQPFIVMQLLQGQTLRDYLASGGLQDKASGAQVSVGRVLNIAIQIADGLEAAHEQGIVHRDIKPANIFITTKGIVKILDFGLAKLPLQPSTVQAIPIQLGGQEALSRPGRAAGTAAYMSPEQVRGRQLDTRTDLFSLGLVLYEMATGQRAFTGSNSAALSNAILSSTPTPPVELNPELPAGLQAVIQKCLTKDRDLRYQSAAQVRSALEKVKRVRRHPVLSRWKLLTVAAVVAVALFAGGFYWRWRGATRLTGKDTIVVAEFNNSTGDAVFDNALNTALATELEQSPFLNVLASDKVSRALKLMTQPPDARLTPEVAREVCRRTNSKAVVSGSISDAGNHYRIELNALDCQTGRALAKVEKEAVNRNDVVKTLGIAGAEIRSQLGEPPASLEKFNKPLDEATSSSPEALQALTEGTREKTRHGDVPASFAYFNRAVELDPNFAQAYLSLGVGYFSVDRKLSVQNFTKAFELRDRVTQRQRYFIDAMYFYRVTGQAEKTIQLFTEWAKNYPMDLRAHNSLSVGYSVLGEYGKSASEAQEAIRLRPVAFAYVNLTQAYLRVNRLDEAKASLDEAAAHDLTDLNLRYLQYILAFLQGDKPAMQEQLTWAIGKPGVEDKFLSAQSDTEAYAGRFRNSRAFSQQATESASRADASEKAATQKSNEALLEAEIGNPDRARLAAEQALVLPPGPPASAVETVAALALARAGAVAQAQTLADKLDREYPLGTLMQNYWLPTIRAAIELERNNPAKAIDLLQAAVPYEMGATQDAFEHLYPAYVRGQAYLKMRQGQKAAAEFRKIVDHRGVMENFVTGALAYLQLGRAQVIMGDTAAARKSYQDFLALWKDADPDIPVYKQGKAEYAKLR